MIVVSWWSLPRNTSWVSEYSGFREWNVAMTLYLNRRDIDANQTLWWWYLPNPTLYRLCYVSSINSKIQHEEMNWCYLLPSIKSNLPVLSGFSSRLLEENSLAILSSSSVIKIDAILEPIGEKLSKTKAIAVY